jgi:hypothetical protein
MSIQWETKGKLVESVDGRFSIEKKSREHFHLFDRARIGRPTRHTGDSFEDLKEFAERLLKQQVWIWPEG